MNWNSSCQIVGLARDGQLVHCIHTYVYMCDLNKSLHTLVCSIVFICFHWFATGHGLQSGLLQSVLRACCLAAAAINMKAQLAWSSSCGAWWISTISTAVRLSSILDNVLLGDLLQLEINHMWPQVESIPAALAAAAWIQVSKLDISMQNQQPQPRMAKQSSTHACTCAILQSTATH